MLDNLDNDNSEAYLKATKEYTQNPGGFTKGELNCQATRRPFYTENWHTDVCECVCRQRLYACFAHSQNRLIRCRCVCLYECIKKACARSIRPV